MSVHLRRTRLNRRQRIAAAIGKFFEKVLGTDQCEVPNCHGIATRMGPTGVKMCQRLDRDHIEHGIWA